MVSQARQIREGFQLSWSHNPSLYVCSDLVELIIEFTLKPPKEYCPEFMEKFTIFVSKHSWQDILKISEERLIQLGCECKIENFSIDCIFYNEQYCMNIPFRVNVFTSADSEDEYVVEFQKQQSGDIFEFLDLFAQFIKQDEGCGMVSRGKTEDSVFPKPHHIPFGAFSEPIILNQNCLDCLLHHLESDYSKVQAEGLSALAKCVQTKANCVLMRRVPSIVSRLCQFFDTDYPKIIYPTLIILKFLLNPFTDSNGEDDTSLTIEEQQKLLSQFAFRSSFKVQSMWPLHGKTYKNLIRSVLLPKLPIHKK